MSTTISHTTLLRQLIPASLAYLGLPGLIFLFGWLRWSLAVPAAGLLLAAAFFLARDERRSLERFVTLEDLPKSKLLW